MFSKLLAKVEKTKKNPYANEHATAKKGVEHKKFNDDDIVQCCACSGMIWDC